MKTEFTRKFQQQVNACNDQKVRDRISEIIHLTQMAVSLSDIRNLKKLKGYKNYYRIRVGDYRIGIAVVEHVVIFSSFDHRSDIYKYFP